MKSIVQLIAAAAAVLASASAAAIPIQLISNGDFEDGTLAGWSASSSNADSCCWNQGWNASVSAADGGAYSVANPIGAYAAYEAFDGTGPKTRTLAQAFVVPNTLASATLSFWDSWYATTFHGGTRPRLFDAYLLDGADTYNIYHLSTDNAAPLPFALQSFDVTSFLSTRMGDTVQLSFVTTIPEYGTGPGGFGLDNVSLITEVPEPTTGALILIGLAVASLVAGREAAKRRRRKSARG